MIYKYILYSMIAVAFTERVLQEGKHKKFTGEASLFICALMLAVLSALRYQNELSDFWVNHRHVVASGDFSWLQCIFGEYKGPINTLLMKISMTVLGDPQWYFAITAFCIVFAFAFFIKTYSPLYFLPIFIFYMGGAFFTSNNITRQYLALAVVYSSWKHMLDKNFVKHFFVIMLAVLIHKSSIVYIPFYFLGNIRVQKKTAVIYVMAGVVLFVLRYQVIGVLRAVLYSNYREDSYGMVASSPLRLIFVPINAFFLYYFIHNKNRVIEEMNRVVGEGRSERFFNYICHGMAIAMLCSVYSATSFLLISRFGTYFGMCNTMCYMYDIKSSNTGNRRLFYLYVILINVLLFEYDFSRGKLCPTPYTPFWLFR